MQLTCQINLALSPGSVFLLKQLSITEPYFLNHKLVKLVEAISLG
jgi:hypothetical protein